MENNKTLLNISCSTNDSENNSNDNKDKNEFDNQEYNEVEFNKEIVNEIINQQNKLENNSDFKQEKNDQNILEQTLNEVEKKIDEIILNPTNQTITTSDNKVINSNDIEEYDFKDEKEKELNDSIDNIEKYQEKPNKEVTNKETKNTESKKETKKNNNQQNNKNKDKNKRNQDNKNQEDNQPRKNQITDILPEEAVDYDKQSKLIRTNKIYNKKDHTYIFALGGLEEIGKNAYVIEHNEETILVDCGIKFASSDMLGMNGIVPSFQYFKDNNITIDSLYITHGHEDHIGGIPYLLQNVNVKTIYAPALAAELIKRRLTEFKEIAPPVIEVFKEDTVLNTKYFTIDFFRVCHSIPDCFGLCIQTPNGNIMSAGDYRFDFGQYSDDTDIHKIIEMSNRKIDLFLAESTNSDQPGFSETEDNIIRNIEYIIKTSLGRVFVATFASNLGRIERVIEKAINLNRKICIMGRSMESNIKTSRKVGYLSLQDTDFISSKEVSNTNDREVLVVLTGSQGEEMAALNLMAEGRYPKIQLKPNDTIIMSSNPIPGNFKSVELLVNKLFKLGVNVIQHSPSLKVHASGHATKQEQQMMMKLINADYIVPIHGESKMLKSMKENAVEIGYEPDDIIIVTNGQKLELKDHVLVKTDYCIDAEPTMIDKKTSSKKTIDLIEDRKWLSEEGVFNVIICKDNNAKNLYKNPMINTRGCFYAKQSTSLIAKMSYSIKDEIETKWNQNPNLTNEEIKEIVTKIILFFIWKNKKKRPVVLISIFEK